MIRSTLLRALALVAFLLVPSARSGADPSAGSAARVATTTTSVAGPTPATADVPSPPANAAAHLIEVTYAGGQVASGARRTSVRLGEKVLIRVMTDVPDEVHVHTYDLKAKVGPGQPAEIELVASIPGRHEVELERKRQQLLTLEVR